jgi:hypothetical protein
METVFLPVPPDSIVSWTTERLKMQTICWQRHSVPPQKTGALNYTAVRTSKLADHFFVSWCSGFVCLSFAKIRGLDSSYSQRFPRTLWNYGVNYRVHNSLPIVLTLIQTKPVHNPTIFLKHPFQHSIPIYEYVFKVASFLQVSPHKPCMHLSSSPHVPYIPANAFFYT